MVNVDVLSNINWKKEFMPDEREVCVVQAEMFEFCQDKLQCDAFDFIKKFMESEIAVNMDKGSPEYYTADSFELLDSVKGSLKVNPLTDKKYTEALHWIGYMYRYWAWLGTPSKMITQLVPVEKAYQAYKGLHTQDTRRAIGMLVEQIIDK